MDLFYKAVWGKGAYRCSCHGTLIRFSAGIGWHHHERITMREKIGFTVNAEGWRIIEHGLAA